VFGRFSKGLVRCLWKKEFTTLEIRTWYYLDDYNNYKVMKCFLVCLHCDRPVLKNKESFYRGVCWQCYNFFDEPLDAIDFFLISKERQEDKKRKEKMDRDQKQMYLECYNDNVFQDVLIVTNQ
jgi:hypothetical protein